MERRRDNSGPKGYPRNVTTTPRHHGGRAGEAGEWWTILHHEGGVGDRICGVGGVVVYAKIYQNISLFQNFIYRRTRKGLDEYVFMLKYKKVRH